MENLGRGRLLGRPVARSRKRTYVAARTPVLCQNSADVFCPGVTGAEEPLHLRRWRETGRRPTDRSSGVRTEVIDHFAAVPWHDAES